MLQHILLASAIGLILSSIVLFATGHRVRFSHWLASLAATALICAASLALYYLLSGVAVLPGASIAVALAVAALTAAIFPAWNPVGHAAFTAVLISATSFLAYAAYVITAARLGPLSLLFASILYFLQASTILLLIAHTFEIIDVVCRTQWNRRAGARPIAGYAPMVSLHVPTHNEPPELVIETLDALAALDCPNFEVLVIDNNTADESLWRPLEEHCRRLGPRFRFFHLMPWPGYKSGALNFATSVTAPDAEIIGIVDADYLVKPNYLADLVGYFGDTEVGFVQTPQDYRDAEQRGRFGRALYLSYLYFFKVSMATRNEYNAIIFAGTMGLIRRSALEAVGGWDEWCITEDAEIALRLLDRGYTSHYIDESYGRGLMPLDYAGLKKQRFRWAFGGMQLLRMHAGKLLNPFRKTELTFPQRFAYISGGLQWLNDPMALAFTVILLVGATALFIGGSFFLQPLVGAAIYVPLLFILFAVLRFLWAFRVRSGCSWREASGALMILLGLAWVVSLACLRGLFSKEGVFLRTPKQREQTPTFGDATSVVRWEIALAAVCLTLGVALLVQDASSLLSARGVTVVLLFWQAATYLGAFGSSYFSYRETAAAAPMPARWRLSFHTIGHTLGRFVPERRIAAWVISVAGITGMLFYASQRFAPPGERVMRADPLRQFIPAASVLKPSEAELAAATLIRESEAARNGNVNAALSLWHPSGEIVDRNYTPHFTNDDRAWKGAAQLRQRYVDEFRQRRYLELRHPNLIVRMRNGDAVIENDVQALIESAGSFRRIHLPRSDRWTMRRFDNQWKVVRLEVNRAPLPQARTAERAKLNMEAQ